MAEFSNDLSDAGSKQQTRPEAFDRELKVTPQLEKLWNDYMDERDKKAEKGSEPSAEKPVANKDPNNLDISPYEYPGAAQDNAVAAAPKQKEGGLDLRPMPKDPGGLDYPDEANRRFKVPNQTYSELPYSLSDNEPKKKERSWEVQEMIDGIERIDKWTDDMKEQDRQSARGARAVRELKVDPMILANKAVDEFNNAPDKAAAIERLSSSFQTAIERSDAQGKSKLGQIAGQFAATEEERMNAHGANAQADAVLASALMAVNSTQMPEEQEQELQSSVNAYNHSVTSRGKENALREISRIAPGLAMAFKAKEQINSQTAPVLEREARMLKSMETAIEPSMSIRETYAKALEQTGRNEQAEQLKKQATEMFVSMLVAQERAKQIPNETVDADEPEKPVVEWEI